MKIGDTLFFKQIWWLSANSTDLIMAPIGKLFLKYI